MCPCSQGLPSSPPVDLPPAKVAIIGAGMGGCFTAMFLRENGGENLDIHVWAKKGSKVGGRSGTREMNGHIYEVGASVIHSRNKYLSDAANNFGEYSYLHNYVHVYVGGGSTLVT